MTRVVIDIDENILNDAKNGYIRLGEIADAVLSGTPLDKIKCAISELDFDFGDYYNHTDKIIEKVISKIDEVTTVIEADKEKTDENS